MHHWQDIVLSIGSLIFAIALVPSIISEHKPALWTSIMTASVLVVFAVVYATLSLWYAMSTTALTAVLWTALAVQKALQKSE